MYVLTYNVGTENFRLCTCIDKYMYDNWVQHTSSVKMEAR